MNVTLFTFVFVINRMLHILQNLRYKLGIPHFLLLDLSSMIPVYRAQFKIRNAITYSKQTIKKRALLRNTNVNFDTKLKC